MKEDGESNDLIARIAADPLFSLDRSEIDGLLDPRKYTGRAQAQVEEFLSGIIKPILDANAEILGEKPELNV